MMTPSIYTPAEQAERGGWIPAGDKPPVGQCLVYLEKALLGLRIHTADYRQNVTFIAGHFSHDLPKVTHWQPLPPAPEEG